MYKSNKLELISTRTGSANFDYFEYLKFLRDECSDEIPDEVIHGPTTVSEPKLLKVRRNWWTGIISSLNLMQKRGLIPLEMQDEVQSFIKTYTSRDFYNQLLTTKDDIKRANELTTAILSHKDT